MKERFRCELVSFIKRLKCGVEAFKKGKSIAELETENKKVWSALYGIARKNHDLMLKLEIERAAKDFQDYMKENMKQETWKERCKAGIWGIKNLDGILVMPEDKK